ncbi:MAG: CcmD family protein [Bacteroidota bacterium]|nr:CcmD family protein [Bacteroidota bacterium]MDE2834289.1 CcmD family protein [Bacteroidota bacterium]MDE2957896.1 CcmD family protein [Bacteroidota bacterium]
MIRLSILAQTAGAVESAMLDNDKLYVVLAVVLVIWVGIALFIFGTDRRIGRLERRIQTLESSPKT